MVKRLAFAVPGDLATPTGGYAYDRRMIAELGRLGWQIDVVELGNGFPLPSETTRATAQARLFDIPKGRTVVIDGLALGALPEAASQLRTRNALLAVVHHPLALETGLSAQEVTTLRASERDALAAVDAIVVTSSATQRCLVEDYAVPAQRIFVAPPGSDSVTPSQGSTDGIVRLLSVGAVVPRKGFDVLIAALATIAELPWHLTIVGDRTRDRKAVAQLDADIRLHRLDDRVTVLGEVSSHHLAELYVAADAFVLASRFEGYGMAYAEALAHGLPVVGTTAGAIPDTVPPNAGVLVEPNDVKALTRTLRMLIGNPKERQWLASGAREAGAMLPTWEDSAKRLASAIEALA